MKRYIKEFKFLILVALVAFAVCWTNNHYLYAPKKAPDAHQLLHEHLNITDKQDQALAGIEERFKLRKEALENTIHQANIELGGAIAEDKQYSERVNQAVEKALHAQGELQKATLEHLFEMQTVLTPEQASELNKMAADALINQ